MDPLKTHIRCRNAFHTVVLLLHRATVEAFRYGIVTAVGARTEGGRCVMNYGGNGQAGVLLRCVDEALLPSSIGALLDPDRRLSDTVKSG